MKDVTLKYFYSNLPIYIETDASKKGIEVVMLQPDNSVENICHTEVPNNLRPVFYASKTLMMTESNYSNIEHEVLGVVFSVLHFKHFTYGRQIHIRTDHKIFDHTVCQEFSHNFSKIISNVDKDS